MNNNTVTTNNMKCVNKYINKFTKYQKEVYVQGYFEYIDFMTSKPKVI